MRIINRHSERAYFTFYKGDEIEPDNVFAQFRVSIKKDVRVDPGKDFEYGMGHDDVQIEVSTTYENGRISWFMAPGKAR